MPSVASSVESLFVNRTQVEAELTAQASRIKQLEEDLSFVTWKHGLLEIRYKEAIAKNEKLKRKVRRLSAR